MLTPLLRTVKAAAEPAALFTVRPLSLMVMPWVRLPRTMPGRERGERERGEGERGEREEGGRGRERGEGC